MYLCARVHLIRYYGTMMYPNIIYIYIQIIREVFKVFFFRKWHPQCLPMHIIQWQSKKFNISSDQLCNEFVYQFLHCNQFLKKCYFGQKKRKRKFYNTAEIWRAIHCFGKMLEQFCQNNEVWESNVFFLFRGDWKRAKI